MDTVAVLAAFDQQCRRRPPAPAGGSVERTDSLTRVLGPGWVQVVWSDLDGAGADAVIAGEVAAHAGVDGGWEWKHYDHDRPLDLPARLAAAGFVAEEPETVMVADLADLDLPCSPPPGVDLVPVTDAAGVATLVEVHDRVFGGSHHSVGAEVLAGLSAVPPRVAAVVALVDGRPVAAGRLDLPADCDFASLWGGGTEAAWRGRGIFRALVAQRARLARDAGYRWLQVDAAAMSRPILARLGFEVLTGTTPWRSPPPR